MFLNVCLCAVYKLKEQFECLNYLNVTFSLKNYWFSDFEIQIQIKITDSLGDKLCKKIFLFNKLFLKEKQ